MATEIPGVTPKKRNWIKIVIIAVVVFIAFAALIISCAFSMGAPVMKSGEVFLTQLSSGQFDAYLANFPVLGKVKSTSFSSFKIENNFGQAAGTITAADGQVSPIAMQFVNENGAWKVLSLDLNPPPVTDTESGI